MQNQFIIYFSLFVLCNASFLIAMDQPQEQPDSSAQASYIRVWMPEKDPNYKTKTEQELVEELQNGSLRDSGEHIMAMEIVRRKAWEQEEGDKKSPRGQRANAVIEELKSYKMFRNDADPTAQMCLANAQKALQALIEFDKQSKQDPQS